MLMAITMDNCAKPDVITCSLCQWLLHLATNFSLRYVEKYYYV